MALYAIVTLGILVAIHEFGHFWVARRCGVKVLKFSIGFGPSLYSRVGRDGVEYSLSAIPLGGYVRMAGENGEEDGVEVAPGEAFSTKPVLQRIAIVAAGPAINLLLAVLIFIGLGLRGEAGLAPIVGAPTDVASVASHALPEGVEIVAVDGEPVDTWRDVTMALLERAGDTGAVDFTVKYPESDIKYHSEIPINDYLAQGEIGNPLDALGIPVWMPKADFIVGRVLGDGAAAKAGVLLGDKILTTDGQQFDGFHPWARYIEKNPGKLIELELLREGRTLNLTVKPSPVELNGETVGRIGVALVPGKYPEHLIRRYHYSIGEAIGLGFVRTYETSMFILRSIGKMVIGDISSKNLSGPISIAKVASDSAESGIYSWLGVLALLSISLGVLNLLPIPMLDGGHLLFYLVELIKGSPVSEAIQQFSMKIGVVLVMLVTVMAIYNDILRL